MHTYDIITDDGRHIRTTQGPGLKGLASAQPAPGGTLQGLSGGLLPWSANSYRLYNVTSSGVLGETLNQRGVPVTWTQDNTFSSVEPVTDATVSTVTSMYTSGAFQSSGLYTGGTNYVVRAHSLSMMARGYDVDDANIIPVSSVSHY